MTMTAAASTCAKIDTPVSSPVLKALLYCRETLGNQQQVVRSEASSPLIGTVILKSDRYASAENV
jgi:hypothetical protein